MRLPNVRDRLLVWLDASRVRRRGDPEHHQLASFLRPGQVALDVGANHGVYTYSLMLCGAVVHAVEPNPALAARLRGARLPRVQVHEAAVGEAEGEAVLFVPRHHRGHQDDPAGSLTGGDETGWKYPVKVTTIDRIATAPVAFMKIDVEGFETQVLAGGWSTIVRDRPTVLIELEDRRTPGCRASIVDRFRAIDYSGWYFDQGDWRAESGLGLDQVSTSGRYINNFLLVPGQSKPPVAAGR